MKKLFILAVLMLFVLCIQAQVMTGKANFATKGGEEGKNYAAIINTKMSKKKLVETTTNFLAKYGLVKKKDVKLDDIDETTSEYSVPYALRQTLHNCAGILGARYTECPTILYATLRFEFHDNGNVMIVLENFSNKLLIVDVVDDKKQSKAYKDYRAEEGAALMTHSTMGKFVIWLNTTDQERKSFYQKVDEYFADIDSKYKVYDQLVKNGEGKWMTGEEYVDYREKLGGPGTKGQVKWIRGALAEGKMISITENRWKNYIRICLDDLFIAINDGISGEITGVAEDGEQTWTIVEGRLVPTDSKQQKKYLKEGKTYYNQAE